MHRFALVGTRLWWRRGASAAVLAAAVVASAAAVVGPSYAAAAAESSLRYRLQQAAPDEVGLHVQEQADVTIDSAAAIRQVLPPGFDPAYHRIVETRQVGGSIQPVGGLLVVGTIDWRDGFCSHLHLDHGRCPTADDEAIVSTRTTGEHGIRVGGAIDVPALPRDVATGSGEAVPGPSRLRIVGSYTPIDIDDRFWFGHDYFGAHPGSGSGLAEGPDTIDSVFVARAAFDAATPGTPGPVWVDYVLDPRAVSVGRVDELRRRVATAQQDFPLDGQPTMTTQLPRVLAAAEHARDGLTAGTTVATLQLLVLAWLVLFQIVAASAESRSAEVAVAKLRGLQPLDTVTFALSEPLVLLVASFPLGLLAGLGAAHALARVVLVPGITPHLPALSVAAAAVAVAGGVVAAVAASRRVLNRPVLDQWRRAGDTARPRRASLAVDALVVIAAILVLSLLLRHSRSAPPGPLPLLAPALLVLAVATVGIRAVPAVVGFAAAATRASRRMGIFLATRQVARRPRERHFAVLLAVAAGVATFAVIADDVAHHNQDRRVRVEVGAARVVNVQPAGSISVTDAVAHADPVGTWAMAAAAYEPVGGAVGSTIEAVDVSRLEQVSDLSPALIARLRAGRADDSRRVAIRATQVRVTYDLRATVVGAPLVLGVATADGRITTARGPATRQGTAITTDVDVPCLRGCRLVDVQLDRSPDDGGVMHGTFVVRRLEQRTSTGGWSDVRLPMDRRAWRAGQHQTDGADVVTVDADGVADDFSAAPGGWPSIELADVPRPLPVVLGIDATTTPDQQPTVADLSGATVPLRRAATLPVLPRTLTVGGYADLSAAQSTLPAFDRLATAQVWLGHAAPADALDRLRRAGLVLGHADSEHAHLVALQQEGPALALQLFFFTAMAAAVLALAATALSLAVTGRRRSFEMAALQTVGVRRAAILRACVLEQLVVLGAAAVLGIVPAVVAGAVTVPHLPQFANSSPVTLDFSPDPAVVLAAIAALAVAVLVTAIAGGLLLLRDAVAPRLREWAP